jgi:uncharacterized membrane protein
MPSSATRDERFNRVLLSLLFAYLVGRVLQLFAGRIPNLVIVIFHVIPPALFAVLHGSRIYRRFGVLVFATLCLGVASFSESLSLRTGFPFGHYEFTSVMGPKWFGLPLLLSLAYLGMGYLSWVVATLILHRTGPLTGKSVVVFPLAASFVMVAWDLSMDPVWADIDHAWIWKRGGAYFGVPISNFLGWYLTVYVFYQLFALYLRNHPATLMQARYWRLAVLFYAASALGNFLVIHSGPATEVFVDASGRSWAIAHILLATRLVSALVMLPLSLLAWVGAASGSHRR